MLVDVHVPDHVAPSTIDAYLQLGWFRMGQTIFTTNFLNFNYTVYSAIWLRIKLAEYQRSQAEEKLFKLNKKFDISITKAFEPGVSVSDTVLIPEEKERLYEEYKQGIDFETSNSLKALLFGTSTRNIFDTYQVEIFDGQRLVAAGYFDVGENAAMGIASFYHPDYKKYSLGRYLIYLKIRFCMEMGLDYFYPGYFVPGYRAFDYKLTIGNSALQYLELQSGQWRRIQDFKEGSQPIAIMRDKLEVLKKTMIMLQSPCEILLYEYFYANQISELSGADLLDYPIFIMQEDMNGETFVVVFNVVDEVYEIHRVRNILMPPEPVDVPGFYSKFVLKSDEIIYSSVSAEDCSKIFQAIVFVQK